jgi:superfamily I DNA/RNA helicase
MKEIIFAGAPRRVYRANRNLESVSIKDPKRVYQCLREFNDVSANQEILNLIQMQEIAS